MSLEFSTGLRNALNAKQCGKVTAIDDKTTISFDADSKTISDSDNGFVDGGIQEGDIILVIGSSNVENTGLFTVDSVSEGDVVVEEDSLVDESDGESITISAMKGGSFKDIFRNGVLEIRSGSQPSDADESESGTLLLTVTRNSDDFSAGSPGNGLNFGESDDGVIGKKTSEIWSGEGITGGTAGYFRFYANDKKEGSSTSAIRFDGSCATSGGQLNMSSTTIVGGATTTIDSFNITLMSSSS